jgi:uncharacterized protein
MKKAYQLNPAEQDILLKIARSAIIKAVNGQALEEINLEQFSPILREDGASFVTLTVKERLRGCIGAIEAYQPLILDVQEHAVAAALDDYRFPSVRMSEIQIIQIEISRLSPLQALEYSKPNDLIEKIRVDLDGVLIKYNGRRATFLPQVWEKVTGKDQFLSQLCLKMGSPADLWRNQKIQVFTYQVEHFKEA